MASPWVGAAAGPIGGSAMEIDALYEEGKELFAEERLREALDIFLQVESIMLDYRNTNHYIQVCKEELTGTTAPQATDGLKDGTAATMSEQNKGKLVVICRLRPLGEQERGEPAAIVAHESRGEVSSVRSHASFRFNRVLTPFCQQRDVFETCVEPLLGEVMLGRTSAVLAFGTVGSGKTHTMEGELHVEAQYGLVPRAMEAILQRVRDGLYRRSQVYFTCLELYNEYLMDFLAVERLDQVPPEIRETGGKVVVDFANRVPVSSVGQVVNLLSKVREKRQIEDSKQIGRSSQAHCIYTFEVDTIEGAGSGDGIKTSGVLHLVDLAAWKGSQRETNSGLLNLQLVIEALRNCPMGRAGIPYADSKLTWLLQEALEGRGRTVLIATAAQTERLADATLAVLAFAEKAAGLRGDGISPSALSPFAPSALPISPVPLAAQHTVVPPTFATPSNEEIELRARVKQLSTELQRVEAQAESLTRQNERLTHHVSEAEERRVKAELLAEEKEFIKANTVEFADRRSGEARALAEALEATNARSTALAESLAKQTARMTGSKAQIQNLFASVEEQIPHLVASRMEPQVAEASDAIEEMAHAHGRAQEALEDAVVEHGRVIDDLSNSLRDKSDRVCSVVRDTASLACEAIVDGRKEADQWLRDVGAAAEAAHEAQKKTQEAALDVAGQFGEALRAHAASLERDLRSGAETHASSAECLAAELNTSRCAFSAAQGDAVRTFDGAHTEFVDLCSQFGPIAERVSSHREVSGTASQRAAADAEAAARRRTAVWDCLCRLMDKHQAAATSEAQRKLQIALDSLGEALLTKGSLVESQLCDVAARIENYNAEVEDSTRNGAAAVRQAVDQADEQLAAAWKESRDELERILSPGDGAAASLATQLLAAVSSLDEVRESVAKEIANLRAQRCSEQRVVQLLRRQQQALQTDMEQTRSAHEQATKELEAVGAALATTEENLARKREALMKTVAAGVSKTAGQSEQVQHRTRALVVKAQKELEALHEQQQKDAKAFFAKQLQDVWDVEDREQEEIRVSVQRTLQEVQGEFQNIGEQFSGTSGLAPALSKIKMVQSSLNSASATVAAGGERALRSSGDAVQLLEDSANEGDAAIMNIASSQERAAVGIRQVQEAGSVGVDGIVTKARAVDTVQETASNRWATARDAAAAAVNQWAKIGHRVAQGLAEATADQSSVWQEVVGLRSEISAQRVAASSCVQEIEADRAQHQTALQSLADLQRANATEDAATEVDGCRVLSGLADGLAADTPAAIQLVEQGGRLLQLMAKHRDTLASMPDVVEPALAAHESAARQHGKELVKAMESAATGVERLVAISMDWEMAAKQCSDEAEAPSRIAAILLEDAEGWHQKAVAGLDAEQARWDELAKTHATEMEVFVATTRKATTSVEAVSTAGLSRAKANREQAEAAHKHCSDTQNELVLRCSSMLAQQHECWKHGLSAQPLVAFAESQPLSAHEILQDSANGTRPIPAYVESVLQGGLPPRPGEAALLAKFRGEKEENIAVPKLLAGVTPKMNAASGGGVTGAGRRSILGEVQVLA